MKYNFDWENIEQRTSYGFAWACLNYVLKQKNAIVSLKFAEVDILKEKKGLYPILILDDIFSELDSEKVVTIESL